jgi:hypothetical protein
VQGALAFIEHCRWTLDPADSAIRVRELTPMGNRAFHLALQVRCAYFSGAMDYGEAPPRRDEDQGDADRPVPVPTARDGPAAGETSCTHG